MANRLAPNFNPSHNDEGCHKRPVPPAVWLDTYLRHNHFDQNQMLATIEGILRAGSIDSLSTSCCPILQPTERLSPADAERHRHELRARSMGRGVVVTNFAVEFRPTVAQINSHAQSGVHPAGIRSC